MSFCVSRSSFLSSWQHIIFVSLVNLTGGGEQCCSDTSGLWYPPPSFSYSFILQLRVEMPVTISPCIKYYILNIYISLVFTLYCWIMWWGSILLETCKTLFVREILVLSHLNMIVIILLSCRTVFITPSSVAVLLAMSRPAVSSSASLITALFSHHHLILLFPSVAAAWAAISLLPDCMCPICIYCLTMYTFLLMSLYICRAHTQVGFV